MKYKIRRLRKNEVGDVLKIFDELPRVFTKKERFLVHKDVLDYLNKPPKVARIYSVIDNQEIIASGGYSNEPEGEDVYDLFWFAVKKGYQNMGIGTRLLKFIEAKLKLIGAHMLLVRTMNTKTDEARLFYGSCGYKKEAVLTDYYGRGKDEAIYYKKL